jgi:hypothetical protein
MRLRETALTAIIIQFNSIQFFIIYVPRQQPQSQLQTQHSVNKSNYNMDNHNNNNNNNNNNNAANKLY